MSKRNKKSKSQGDKLVERKLSATKNVPLPSDMRDRSATTGAGGLSSAQFCGLLFLALGATYLLEFRHVLKNENCQDYVIRNDDKYDETASTCSQLDLTLIRAKYYSGILSESLVALCMLLCWYNEPLFLRLNALLCSSPLITTLMAMESTKSKVQMSHYIRLGLLIFALILVVTSFTFTASFGNSSMASRLNREGLSINIQNVTLLTVMLVYTIEAIKFLGGKVESYLDFVPTEENNSTVSVVLLPFMAVDACTAIVICFFGIAYLTDTKKRVSSVESCNFT
jgi:hypothetical protein